MFYNIESIQDIMDAFNEFCPMTSLFRKESFRGYFEFNYLCVLIKAEQMLGEFLNLHQLDGI